MEFALGTTLFNIASGLGSSMQFTDHIGAALIAEMGPCMPTDLRPDSYNPDTRWAILERDRMRFNASQFTPPSGGNSEAPPPAGAAGGGSGSGKPGGLRPGEAIQDLHDYMHSGTTIAQINNRILVHTAKMGEAADELQYLERAAHMLGHIHHMRGRQNTEHFLSVMHFIGRLISTTTDFVTPFAIEKSVEHNVGETATIVLRMTHGFERAIVEQNGIVEAKSADSIAFLQMLGALKGANYFAIRNRRDRSNEYESIVAKTLLMMQDSAIRFRNINTLAKATQVEGLIVDVKKAHGIPDENIEWAKHQIKMLMSSKVRKIAEFQSSGEQLYRYGVAYFMDITDLALGNTMFSPWLFEESASLLRENRLDTLAEEHEVMANDERTAAKTLGFTGNN